MGAIRYELIKSVNKQESKVGRVHTPTGVLILRHLCRVGTQAAVKGMSRMSLRMLSTDNIE